MNITEFYETFGISKKDQKTLKSEKLFNLYQIPKKIKQEASTSDVEANATHQADILYMPIDPVTNEKYALVVCDVGGYRQTDAIPLKNRDAKTVLEAFKIIYGRGILTWPTVMIQIDGGSEFKGVVKNYFEDKDIVVRVGKRGRHQMQASVEAKNYIIGKALHMRMSAEEMITGAISRDWIDYLPKVITAMNKRLKDNTPSQETIIANRDKPIRVSGKGESVMLDEGTRVRVALDEPINVYDNSKLHGKFRASDIRFENDITTIKQIILRANQPIMYLTEKYPSVPYHTEQLQVVSEVENLPPESIIKRFEIEKIVGKRKVNNRIQYRIKWLNYGNNRNTWEGRKELIEDGNQNIIDAYEATL